jgi:hypothetical protein
MQGAVTENVTGANQNRPQPPHSPRPQEKPFGKFATFPKEAQSRLHEKR